MRRAPTEPTARIESELREIGRMGLQPTALVVASLYVVFAIYNVFRLPPGARVPVISYDLVLSVFAFALAEACRRITLSLRAVRIAAATLSFAVLGNLLLYAAMVGDPRCTYYVAVLVVASGASVTSPPWAAAIVAVEVASWGVVTLLAIETPDLVSDALVVVSGVAVAVIVHVGRHRAQRRILELRAGDARRELALEAALAEADEARRGLDQKVLERTQALRAELAERERLEAQLRHAQKLEAVGRLAGGVAHDFNNLLTVIRLSLGTLGEPGRPGEEVTEALRDASDATDRAAALTHDLLAFARKQTLERTPVEVGEILASVERMVRRVAEAGIRLQVELDGELGEVVADRHQVEQVLLNLAINACDAMGTRGTLTLQADCVELAGTEAAERHVRPGSYARISVRDTGTGMDDATMRAAFEPFFTTKEVGRGTGLGLAVAHGIVTQHGGHIEVESALGVGSTFRVYLPRARSSSPRVAAPAMRPIAAARNETVLVVEDEPAVRRALQRNLERLGYRVLAACDGEHALNVASTLAGVDLLVSDVVMPGIDGPELACQLRARWTDLPVLFVTGYSADRLARSDALRAHDRVLEKPYQLEELARTIRQMIRERAERSVVVAAAG